MIDSMSIVALIVGMLVGYWCFSRETLNWLFIIISMAAHSSKSGFYEIYDTGDDDVSFKLYTDSSKDIITYADYLKLHADARPLAYKTLKNTYGVIKRQLLFLVLPVIIVPAVLFWSNWYFHLLGVAIVLVGLVANELVKNGFRPGFYQRVAIYATLRAHAKSSTKEDRE